MENIRHKIIVLSGKGGVGKSSVAVNLAVWLSMQSKNVGLLDIDIHGPSIPKLLNLDGRGVQSDGDKIKPVIYSDTLKIMSIGFLLQDEKNALIWRGPMKHNVIKQFVTDVSWGNLDYLVIDCPPGTGDEPLSIVQLPGAADGAVIITTPQQLAVIDVKKCITFCRQLNLTVLGVIENMSGFVCPHCNRRTDIFKGSGGKEIAVDLDVPFLGSVPIDSAMVAACDSGSPFVCYDSQSPALQALKHVFELLLRPDKQIQINKEAQNNMRIAIPVTEGRLSAHFGHCREFAIIDADAAAKKVTNTEMFTPPAHEPGALPKWLSGMCVDLVIAGGMGRRAQQLFAQSNIDVLVGAMDNTPQELALQYLTGRLQSGKNICDH
jgi:Mrp family chromosome partitioning ATPase/predicted Fe-Mo cluster-binding NifX family protein